MYKHLHVFTVHGTKHDVVCIHRPFFFPIGPPLQPHVDLISPNHTLLQITWNKPFAWTEVADVTNYTVSAYNSSSQEWKNVTVLPSVNNITFHKTEGPAKCVEMYFYVSATNIIGTSPGGRVIGGFPERKTLIYFTAYIYHRVICHARLYTVNHASVW